MNYFPNIYKKAATPERKDVSLSDEKESIEKILIEETLLQTNGNKSEAAKKLGISRVTLYNKIKKYGIKV